MRFSTCRMSISASSSASRCSRRVFDVEHLEHLLLLLELQRQVRGDRVGQAARPRRCPTSEVRISGGIFLFSFTYWSNCASSARRIASTSLRSRLVGRRSASTSATKCVACVGDRARCARAARPRPAPSRCRRAASASAGCWRRCRSSYRSSAAGLVLGGGLLGDQQDALARLHRGLQRLDRLRAPDEQRDHHVREHHHVAQRQQRQRRPCRRLGSRDVDMWVHLSWIDRNMGHAGDVKPRRLGDVRPLARTPARAAGSRQECAEPATLGWSAIDQQRLAVVADRALRRRPP